MNPLSLSLSNRDEYHSYPAKGNRDCKSFEDAWGSLIACQVARRLFPDKYPLGYLKYIYSVKGEPLTVVVKRQS